MCYERRRAECQYKVCVYYTEIVYTEIYYFALLVTSRHSKTHVLYPVQRKGRDQRPSTSRGSIGKLEAPQGFAPWAVRLAGSAEGRGGGKEARQ